MKKTRTLFLILSLLIFLTGCTTKNKNSNNNNLIQNEMKKDELKKADETSGNAPSFNDEELIKDKDTKLNLGKKAVIDEEEFKIMYGNDTDMLNLVEQFVGRLAPNFEIVDLEGKKIELEDFRGENIIVEIIGTWCLACNDVALAIDNFNNEKENQNNFKVISVFVDESVENAKRFLNDNGLSYKNFYISENDEIFDLYNINFIPISFYLDKEGYVQMITGGDPINEMTKDLYENLL